MGLKELFIVPKEGETKNKKNGSTKETKFPSFDSPTVFETNTFSKTPEPQENTSGKLSQELVTKFSEMYQKGFDSLNQNGYDFYEYFQAVTHGGIDNPQIYTMAMAMANGMDKSVTKEKLLEQADFYINEIVKVYNKQVDAGNKKKEELTTQKGIENQNLVSELANLKEQMEALRIQIQDRESKLSQIGNKYQPQISEIEGKLMANDFAKNKIVSTIESVKNGIVNNLK